MKQDRDGVFTRKDREGFWISWQDVQGRRRYRKTDAKTLEQARRALSAERVRVVGFAPPTDEAFAELAGRYLAHQRARVNALSFKREKAIVEGHLQPFFAGPVKNIRRADVQRYITSRSGEVGASSLHKELVTIKHALSLAVEWEMIPLGPAASVKGPKLPPGRLRYLQPGEIAALLDACPNWLQPIAALALGTGMRRGEILSLRWLDIDFSNRRILLPQTKNGDSRIVYLNHFALAALESPSVGPETKPIEKVFSSRTPAQVSVAFQRAVRRAGIADFRFHDCRHTAASWLRMAGADIHTVALLLGHKDLRMAARYQHLSPSFLAEAVARLDGVFGQVRYPGVTEIPAQKAPCALSA